MVEVAPFARPTLRAHNCLLGRSRQKAGGNCGADDCESEGQQHGTKREKGKYLFQTLDRLLSLRHDARRSASPARTYRHARPKAA